jgi:hypothetical protein
MSHSVPSESSPLDTTFIVGVELVEFDRRELPIYLKPQTPWAQACIDEVRYGAPVDRVFGEGGDIHIDSGALAANEQQAAGMPTVSDDPLILRELSDGLLLPAAEPSGAREFGAVFAKDPELHAVVDLGDGGTWNITDATFDFVA